MEIFILELEIEMGSRKSYFKLYFRDKNRDELEML